MARGLATKCPRVLVGRRPFQRQTAAETHAAILRDDPPRPSERDHPVPPGIEAFVVHCLAKRTEERYQPARHLVFPVEAVASGAEIPLSPLASAADASRRRRRLVTGRGTRLGSSRLLSGYTATARSLSRRERSPGLGPNYDSCGR